MILTEWIAPAALILVLAVILIVRERLAKRPKPKNYYRYR
jgi:hypothetical protein